MQQQQQERHTSPNRIQIGWAQVNRIRQSLALIARNSSAFGLVQPHLERTKLCQLGDEALEPKYVRQRAALQQLVASLAHPKVGCEGKETLRQENRQKEGAISNSWLLSLCMCARLDSRAHTCL